MAAAKPRRISTGASGQHILTGGYITKYNGNKPITPSMLKKTLSELPEGFQYPRHFRKKVGVVRNKSISDTSVWAAQKCKVMCVHSVCNDTTDDDMRGYIEQNVVPVQNFEQVCNPASATKSFKVKILIHDVKKMLDANMWPSGIGCNYWKFPVKTSNSMG